MKLSARDWRAILAGAIAVAVILTYAGIVRPLRRGWSDLTARREATAETFARYRDLIVSAGSYAAAAESADARLSRLLPETFAGDPQSALNRLLETLQKAATGNDVRVTRASPAPVDSAGPGLLRIGASLECASDLAGLLGLLRTLETAGKLFHVTGLHVATAGDAAGSDEVQVLRFGFTVRAFVPAPLEQGDDAQTAAG